MTGRLALAITIFCLVTAPLPGSTLARAEEEVIRAPKQELLLRQKKIERLQEGIETQKSLIEQTQKKSTGLLAELEDFERKIKAEEKKLTGISAKIASQEALTAARQTELDAAMEQQQGAGAVVGRRLAAYYRMGKIGFLNASFSSRSLHELLQFDEYYRYLIRHDLEIMDSYRQATEKSAQAVNILKAEKNRLNELIAAVNAQKLTLAAAHEERLALLNRVKTEKDLHQQALGEIEEAASRLTDTITVLKDEAAREQAEKQVPKPSASPTEVKPKDPAATGNFAARKGRLPPPVEGAVTTVFGESRQGKFGVALSSDGIDIETSPGATLIAIHPGKVVYDGEQRGYGRLMIIDHGGQYYTLMARAERFYKQKGDQVEAGEAIGVMGTKGSEVQEGLHFEIRRGSTPLDPMQWLDGKKITAGRTGAR